MTMSKKLLMHSQAHGSEIKKLIVNKKYAEQQMSRISLERLKA